MTRSKHNKSKKGKKANQPGTSASCCSKPASVKAEPSGSCSASSPSPPCYEDALRKSALDLERTQMEKNKMQEELRRLQLEQETNRERLTKLKAELAEKKAKELEEIEARIASHEASLDQPIPPPTEQEIMVQSICKTISEGVFSDIDFLGPGPVYDDPAENPYLQEVEQICPHRTNIRRGRLMKFKEKPSQSKSEKPSTSKVQQETIKFTKTYKGTAANAFEVGKRFASEVMHMANKNRVSIVEVEICCGPGDEFHHHHHHHHLEKK